MTEEEEEYTDLSTEHTLPPAKLLILVHVKHTVPYPYIQQSS